MYTQVYAHVQLYKHVTHHLPGCHCVLPLSILELAGTGVFGYNDQLSFLEAKRYNELPKTFNPALFLGIDQNQCCIICKFLLHPSSLSSNNNSAVLWKYILKLLIF